MWSQPQKREQHKRQTFQSEFVLNITVQDTSTVGQSSGQTVLNFTLSLFAEALNCPSVGMCHSVLYSRTAVYV